MYHECSIGSCLCDRRYAKMAFLSFKIVHLICAFALPSFIHAQQVINNQNNNVNINYRLPNFTHPISYDLSLSTRIDLVQFDFFGQVKINIAVDVDTREIVLHARQLNITGIRLARYTGSEPSELPLLPYTYDGVTEFLHIKSDGPVMVAGERLLLDITYTGTLRTDNGGFYRTSYVDASGARK